MSKSVGVREARKAAYRMAAAMLRDHDLEEIFADLYADNMDDAQSVQNLTDAVEHCADRIAAMGGDAN